MNQARGHALHSEVAKPQLSIISPTGSGDLHRRSSAFSRLLFYAAWYAVNVALLLSLAAAGYAITWEYSTRRYLKGFADAIIPASVSTTSKVEAILDWMAHGPARTQPMPEELADDRDPTDTLNYAALLTVCGTATNAFVNLANTGGIAARRLLLLDSNRATVHVVAEVLIDGRWIIVDPAFRTFLRGPGSSLLTREQLTDRGIFSFATRDIRGYLPIYNFDHAVHIRVARIGRAGLMVGRLLDRIAPGWDSSITLTLLTDGNRSRCRSSGSPRL